MTKIKVPQTVKILTHTYKVRLNEIECIGASAMGLCKHVTEELIIAPHALPSQKNQSFLHEVLHMIERYMVIKMDDTDIDRFAEGLAVFLFDDLGIELDWSDIEEDKS